MAGAWRLEGYDPFSGEGYSISSHATEEEVRAAARAKLRELGVLQPSSSSGGQGFGGLQERLFIVGPDGNYRRFLG